MPLWAKVGFDGKAVRRLKGIFSRDFQKNIRRYGSYLYVAFIFFAAGVAMWLILTLTSIHSLSELQPRLHTALAPLSIFFGGNPVITPTGAGAPAVVAQGQIAAMDALDVLSPHSAKIVSVSVKEGQMVEADQIVAKLNDADAQRSIRDAQTELANAKIELQKLTTPNATTPGASGSGAADAALKSAYDQGFTSVSDTFLVYSWIIDGNRDILFGGEVNPGVQENMYAYFDMVKERFPDVYQYREKAAQDYTLARDAFNKTAALYARASVNSSPAEIDALLNETYSSLTLASQSMKSTNEFLMFVKSKLEGQRELPPALPEHISGIQDRAQTVNDNLESMRNAQSAIRDAKQGIANAQPAAPEGPRDVDLRDAQLRIETAEHSLADARLLLDEYVVRAPTSGKIARIDARAGRAVVQGEILATITSPQNVARVGVKEADIGKVRVGQKARVSFDAIEGLTIDGTVIKVDQAATVADNTVLFYIYVGFAAEELRPKPGMTTTVSVAY